MQPLIPTYDSITCRDSFPNFVKYMGSKSALIDEVVSAIDRIYEGELLCDLFAGSATLSGVFGNQLPMISNDIQKYSAVLAETYFSDYTKINMSEILLEIVERASIIVEDFKASCPELNFSYKGSYSLKEFQQLENAQQALMNRDFNNSDYHLFTKYYSGTYWSYDQCLWIDALKKVADRYADTNIYYGIISSLMFAMAYNAQSTGHYAQYRDAKDDQSMVDISIYRNKKILPYFEKKFGELGEYSSVNKFNQKALSLNYEQCIDLLPSESLIYADPPYAFVHYSRFYHALETLVRYDYPKVAFKGRYRSDRHQSPFCQKSNVQAAFEKMFFMASQKKCKVVLSYSNTGMISLERIINIIEEQYGSTCEIIYKGLEYSHSTMGRKNDKSREVTEYLVTVIPV